METWKRVRVVFGKEGRLRFLGQLDLGRTLDRALRLSGLPARFSEGFNPHLRLSFPCASPTGMASRCELVEVQVAAPAGAPEVLSLLGPSMPPGLPLLAAEEVPDGERLQLRSAAYEARPREAGCALPPDGALEALLARESVPVEKRGRTVDLRPLLEDLRGGGDRLAMVLRFRDNGATARPEDVLGALGAEPRDFVLQRTAMTASLRRGGAETLRSWGEPS
jgi:radical SAM-linked protein